MKRLAVVLGVGTALSGAPVAQAGSANEQAVIVHFTYGSRNLDRLFALENQLGVAIAKAKAGEYDGNEVAVDGSDGTLFMYGPDAEHLFEVVRPILVDADFMQGAKVSIRNGPPMIGVKERSVVINR